MNFLKKKNKDKSGSGGVSNPPSDVTMSDSNSRNGFSNTDAGLGAPQGMKVFI